MVLYLSILCILVVVLSLIDVLCGFIVNSALITILLILGSVVIEIAINGLFAFIINKLPNKWFDVDNKIYNVSKKERNFYEKLQIRKWKDKIWELGSLGGFSKKSLKSSTDKEYIKKFIVECNKGVMTQFVGMIASFLIIPILLPLHCTFFISIPIAIDS